MPRIWLDFSDRRRLLASITDLPGQVEIEIFLPHHEQKYQRIHQRRCGQLHGEKWKRSQAVPARALRPAIR